MKAQAGFEPGTLQLDPRRHGMLPWIDFIYIVCVTSRMHVSLMVTVAVLVRVGLGHCLKAD